MNPGSTRQKLFDPEVMMMTFCTGIGLGIILNTILDVFVGSPYLTFAFIGTGVIIIAAEMVWFNYRAGKI